MNYANVFVYTEPLFSDVGKHDKGALLVVRVLANQAQRANCDRIFDNGFDNAKNFLARHGSGLVIHELGQLIHAEISGFFVESRPKFSPTDFRAQQNKTMADPDAEAAIREMELKGAVFSPGQRHVLTVFSQELQTGKLEFPETLALLEQTDEFDKAFDINDQDNP